MCAEITLVIGGASSGKSHIAEKICKISALNLIYLATSQPLDEEMRTKVDQHRTARGAHWHTIEQAFDLSGPLNAASDTDCILIDCATMWLSNHLLSDHDIIAQTEEFCTSLAKTAAKIVIVSNEVGQGIVPENALARRFRIAQGQLNQRLAREADCVVGVMAGLPFALKGALPEGLI